MKPDLTDQLCTLFVMNTDDSGRLYLILYELVIYFISND